MKQKLYDKIFLFLLCVTVISAPTALMIFPSREFSKKENRPLASAPDLSLSSFANGSYFERLSDYVKDQFPFRDSFVSAHSLCELSLLKLQVNDVLLAENQVLVRIPSEYNTQRISSNLKALQGVGSLFVPPRSVDIFRDSLPKSFDYGAEREIYSLLPSEAYELLEGYLLAADEDDYYKTDHHWTGDGAYLAYTQICNALGIKPYKEEHFTKEIASRTFRGSSFSRSGLPEYACDTDKIILYRFEGDTRVRVTNHETKKTTHGFYDYSAIGSSDEYRIFLGGNYSHLSISSGDENEKKPTLLLIKDSFANSLVPFLSLHYDIELIDPRYCTSELLNEKIREGKYSHVLSLLSIDTLSGIELNLK